MILFIAICEQNYKLNHKMEGCHWFWWDQPSYYKDMIKNVGCNVDILYTL